MEKISSLIPTLNVSALQSRDRAITFVEGDGYSWSPTTATITYTDSALPEDIATFLHEVGHALCGHASFSSGVELIAMEQEAWAKGVEIADSLAIFIAPETVETNLDTYRDWLHSRSLCPTCAATGIETTLNHFSCLACHSTWRANEARLCALRRYKTQKTP